MSARPAAYPYHRWPRWTRREAALVTACARTLSMTAPQRAADALGELLGVSLRLEVAAPRAVAPDALAEAFAEPLVAAVLLPASGRGCALLELDPRLALCVIDRTLGGEAGAELDAPAGPLGDAERGVLGYVIGRALAQASEPPWRVGPMITTPAAAIAALGREPAVCAAATLRIAEDHGGARLWLPERALDPHEPVAASPQRAAAPIARMPLDIVVEAGAATLPAAELVSLRPGDVVVLDEAWIEPHAGGWRGRAAARIAGAQRARWWCTIEVAGLRLESVDVSAEPSTGEGNRMRDENEDTQRVLAQAGDAPIDMTVEIARFHIPLQELAALRAGEIVATGRAVGERVTLRAGGRALAWGELVDVDGEVGVRIVRLAEGVASGSGDTE